MDEGGLEPLSQNKSPESCKHLGAPELKRQALRTERLHSRATVAVHAAFCQFVISLLPSKGTFISSPESLRPGKRAGWEADLVAEEQ